MNLKSCGNQLLTRESVLGLRIIQSMSVEKIHDTEDSYNVVVISKPEFDKNDAENLCNHLEGNEIVDDLYCELGDNGQILVEYVINGINISDAAQIGCAVYSGAAVGSELLNRELADTSEATNN